MARTSWWIVDLFEYPAHDIKGGRYSTKEDAEKAREKMHGDDSMLVIVEAPDLFTALEKAPNASRIPSNWFVNRVSEFSDISKLEEAFI